MSNQAQLTARPTRRPRAHSDRRDQEPLHRPGPYQARRRPYSRSKCLRTEFGVKTKAEGTSINSPRNVLLF